MILRKRRNDRILGVSQDTPLGPRRNGATLGKAERGRAGVDGVADVTHELGKKILTLGGIADPHEGSKGLEGGGGALPLGRESKGVKVEAPRTTLLDNVVIFGERGIGDRLEKSIDRSDGSSLGYRFFFLFFYFYFYYCIVFKPLREERRADRKSVV